MKSVIITLVAVSTLSLSGLFASTAVAGNVHKTVVVHANGNVTKKVSYGPTHHHHHHNFNHHHHNPAFKFQSKNFSIRIGG